MNDIRHTDVFRPLLECHECGQQVCSYEHVRLVEVTLERHQRPDGTQCPCTSPALFPRRRA